jgi:hypothetical protein
MKNPVNVKAAPSRISRRLRTVATNPEMMASESIARDASLPRESDSATGSAKIFPSSKISSTVRLQSLDQKV